MLPVFLCSASSRIYSKNMAMVERKPSSPCPFCALLISLLLLCTPMREVLGRRHGSGEGPGPHGDTASQLRTYIVHVEQPADVAAFSGHKERDAWYRSFLPVDLAAEGGGFGESRWVHSYHEVLSGFAARLTEEEVAAMEKKEGFLHAYPDVVLPLATTHTPEFLGLHLGSGFWGGGGQGEGVIVGMIDSGYSSSHPSFNDEGMPPPPSRWKGSCPNPIYCNKKVIGGRTFIAGDDAPTDEIGHGTHTASTVAGSFVENANLLGNANGTASGVAPRAYLAIYKVCNIDGCQMSNAVAGMDAAVADGVDVLSISLGGEPSSFSSDGIAIAAFGATKKGVFVSCSAGNDGPSGNTVINDAPWILTVGASTIDRSLAAAVKLGDGSKYEGESAFQPSNFTSDLLPLVFAGNQSSFFCDTGSLDSFDVKGKVVVCDRGGGIPTVVKGANVLKSGGAAMIVVNGANTGNTTEAAAHVLPASHVTFVDGSEIKAYIKSSSNPRASISFEGTKLGSSSSRPSPAVASFSSRGPSTNGGGILKPDVVGPGVNILAAWPFLVGPPTGKPNTKLEFFNIISGTSMSTPHLSGVAALLKGAQPDWSPAAIKSAIMTTSYVRGNDGEPIKDEWFGKATVFAMGAGHVNVTSAGDPGLIYDLSTDDYIAYICDLGYTDQMVAAIVGQQGACSTVKSTPAAQLNYPSISVILLTSPTVSLNRTVTNVGEAGETYKVEVEEPNGVTVSVNPQTLKFSAVKEKQNFTVTITRHSSAAGLLFEGSLRWVSAKHTVRSPINVIAP